MPPEYLYQERYWKELYELKAHVYYLELYYQESVWWDNAINIFLAIASSSSIAGWVIWQRYGFVWAVIIALSQVVTAVKIYLPFNSRTKSLAELLPELESLTIFAETNWFDVSEGNLTEKQIHELRIRIMDSKSLSTTRHLKGSTLPEREALLAKAIQLANNHFSNFYLKEVDND